MGRRKTVQNTDADLLAPATIAPPPEAAPAPNPLDGPPTKTSIILDLARQGKKAKEIADTLTQKGMPTTSATVYSTLNAAKKREGKTRRTRRQQAAPATPAPARQAITSGVQADDLIQLLTLAKRIGIDRVKALLATLS
jgi:hypothetical protein